MTISLKRRQKLAAIAQAHDAWVDSQLSAVSSDFDPSAFPKPGSDYNQHNVDVDASGDAEDTLAAMVEEAFGGALTAAGWKESEHPRGPDGKFIEDGFPDGDISEQIKNLEEKWAVSHLSKNVAYLKGDNYKAQALAESIKDIEKQINDLKAKKNSQSSNVSASQTEVKKAKQKLAQAEIMHGTDRSKWSKQDQKAAAKLDKIIAEGESGKSSSKQAVTSSSPVTSKNAGKPITAWTKTIYSGKYGNGEVVAVKDDGSERLYWDEEIKKFIWQKKNPSGDWDYSIGLNKKQAYEQFKAEKKSWLTPGDDNQVKTISFPKKAEESVVPKPAKSKESKFKILPRSERGQSGDGYFAPGFWGKYGAAGLMMRHVDDNGTERFLLVQANMADNPNTYGKWQLPGGALEEFETPEQGAAREAFEELGFDQDFLDSMEQKETHAVSFDLAPGQWTYSNITVDVPTRPTPNFDPNELGGAQWFTTDEIASMRAQGQIIKPLEANLDAIFAKFSDKPTASKIPETQPLPPPPVRKPSNVPVISDVPAQSITWTKAKFNTTTAYKKDYANKEIVGVALLDNETKRIVWETGQFAVYRYEPDGLFSDPGTKWVFDSGFKTKKAALTALKDVPFMVPPKGTMKDKDGQYISTVSLYGKEVTTKGSTNLPDLDTPKVVLTNFAQPFTGYKTSLIVSDKNGAHLGAIHEKRSGEWFAAGAAKYKNYISSDNSYKTKDEAIAAFDAIIPIAQEDKKLSVSKTTSVKSSSVGVTAPAASVPKKLPKMSAVDIEKQNGTIPSTLKYFQKSNFLQNLRKNSPAGSITSFESNPENMLVALVFAVQKHNETESPKLNHLQGLNVFTQAYGSIQKNNLIAWLKTSEGKAKAPSIIAGKQDDVIPSNAPITKAESGTSTATKVNKNRAIVSSPYELGTPKKVPAYQFKEFSLSDAIDMHQEMEKVRPLTSVQRHVVTKYTQSASPFNDPLRGEASDWSYWEPKDIADLQSAMRPVTQSFVVRRQTGGLGAVLNSKTSELDIKKLTGAIIKDPAFLSTSIPGGTFSQDFFELVINVPKGTPAVWAHHFSSWDNEREILLAAGLHYRIDEIGPPESYGRKVYLTVVPEAKNNG